MRQSINVNPAIREFEAYMDFSGGLNTETSNERLSDIEFTQMTNVNLNSRGSVKKRSGRVLDMQVVDTTNPSVQGMFFFYRADITNPDFIFAINGKLYYRIQDSDISNLITITGLTDNIFQTDRIVEAVQYYDQLYVATGTELVKVTYNPAMGGSYVASVVTGYEPTDQEIKFIGTNSLLGYAMQNKDDATITSTEGFYIKGITFSDTLQETIINGVRNERFVIDAYINHNTAYAGYIYSTGVEANPTYDLYFRKDGYKKSAQEIVSTTDSTYTVNTFSLPTKGYNLKNPVRLASTTNVAGTLGTTRFTTTSPLTQLDGVSLVVGDRVLLKNQTSAFQNGLYSVHDTNDTQTELDRVDMLHGDNVDLNIMVYVTSGTLNSDKYFEVVSTNGSGTVGGNAINWAYVDLSNSSYEQYAGTIKVFVNDAELESGVGFRESSSSFITLTTPVANGTKVSITWTPSWVKTNEELASIPSIPTGSPSKFYFEAITLGSYDFKVVATFTIGGVKYKREYVYENFEIKATKENEDVYNQKSGGIKSCNRIRLHWGRIILFGDTEQQTQMYFSDLDNPAYYPTTNMVRFDTGKQEPIVAVVRIQDNLAIFSKTIIYVLSGKNPSQYSVILINDQIGCIAERSAVLTGNVVTFLSAEGVYILKPSTFKLDQLNVQRVDVRVKSEMPIDANACALAYDSQYWLCFPDKKIVYRYYYEQGIWVKDISNKLNIVQFLQYGQNVYNLTQNSELYKHDNAVYTDAGTLYDMVVESKYFDLSKSFNYKKLKKLHILAKCYQTYDAEFKTSVYADSQIVLDPESGTVGIDENDYVVWNVSTVPNVRFTNGTTLGFWDLGEAQFGEQLLSVQKARIRGKCRRVKIKFVNSQDHEVEIFGFGLEFKLKKP